MKNAATGLRRRLLRGLLTVSAIAACPLFAQHGPFPVLKSFEIGSSALGGKITEDAEGVLYFASTNLVTFDGERWSRTPVPRAYGLRDVDFSPDGRLWAAATANLGWFDRTSDSQWTFKSLFPQLPPGHTSPGEIWNVFPDDGGATFVAAEAILRWNGREFAVWAMPGTRRLVGHRDPAGRIFVHYLKNGLYTMEAAGPTLLVPRAVLGDNAVFWVEQQPSGLLLGTSGGFFLYNGTGLIPFAPDIAEFLRLNRLTCVTRLPDGKIAVGTLHGGAVFLHGDGTVDRYLSQKDGLPSPYISSFHLGRSNDLWILSGTHATRMPMGSQSAIFDERAGLPKQPYRRIGKVHSEIVVGGEDHAYHQLDNTSSFVPIGDLRGRWHAFREFSESLLLAGFKGIRMWNGDTLSSFYESHHDVFAVLPSRALPGSLYIAEPKSIHLAAPGAAPREVVCNLPDTPTELAEDASNRVWLTTYSRGVLIAETHPDRPVEAHAPHSSLGLPSVSGNLHLRSNATRDIVIVADGGAWVMRGSSKRFNPVRNFPARPTSAVSEFDANGCLWLVHHETSALGATVARISFNDSGAVWEPHSIDELPAIGTPLSIYADVAVSGATTVWVGGSNSVLKHTVTGAPVAPAPRPPLLRAFARASSGASRLPITTALPYTTQAIELEFAAPEFNRRESLRLQTKIDGIDEEWVTLGSSSNRELTAVRDGRYTVRARVMAETGVRSEETNFTFEVLPPWWRTTPAFVGVAIALGVFGYGGYRLRVRSLRRRTIELEKKVQVRTEELVAANAAKTQFVANMSHDIRNPLNGIVGLALALEDTRLDPRQREIVATLRECTTYLSSLVDDVLDFASIEAGRVELRAGPFCPPELLRSIVETLKADTAESGALLTTECAPNVPPNLLADAGRIQQILVNFVSNALKYAGGHIRLSACIPPDSPSEIEFAVQDEGPGLSESEQAVLFTKFSRLKSKHGEDEIPGTGLGLAACRSLADIMGGAVGVVSQPGKGARFFLRLPLMIAAEPAEASTANLPNTTVLLVEDTDYNAWAASAVLAKLGLSCERARTGAEALQLFSEKRFNVVLLDRNLPDMDGTEVARRIREMETDGFRCVLLAVTAYCTAQDRELCLESGMDAFVGKPVTPEKLRKVLLAASRKLIAAASVHASPDTSAPTEIDLSLLRFLSDGSAEGLESQVERFLATLEEIEAELREHLGTSDFAQLAASAHRLLGHAKMVSATSLMVCATQFESAARANDETSCRTALARAHKDIEATTEAMRHHRPGARSA